MIMGFFFIFFIFEFNWFDQDQILFSTVFLKFKKFLQLFLNSTKTVKFNISNLMTAHTSLSTPKNGREGESGRQKCVSDKHWLRYAYFYFTNHK
jgi:hypothetical protein